MSEIISQGRVARAGRPLDRRREAGRGPCRIKPDLVLYTAGSVPPTSCARRLRASGELDQGIRLSQARESSTATESRASTIELIDGAAADAEQIVLAARPCDAAALPILDHVFNWDFQRRVLQSPPRGDHGRHAGLPRARRQCFCTSVGLGPATHARLRRDAVRPRTTAIIEVRCLTEKGRRLFAGQNGNVGSDRGRDQGPRAKFDLDAVGEFLAEQLRRPALAAEHALACLGCGACAYTCPTCHCFDIVDEGSAAGGVRVRNWDACQFADVHAARLAATTRAARRPSGQRQRIYHKFSHLSGEVRRDPLHRLRQLHAQLPGGTGRAYRWSTEIQPCTNIYKPDLMEVVGVRQHTRRREIGAPAFPRSRSAPARSPSAWASSASSRPSAPANRRSTSAPAPTGSDHIEFCFRKVGRVTEALWKVEEGDTLGFRGPYGNGYPDGGVAGKDLIFLGGGIAMPPIRCAIWYALENRDDYGDITIVYGARTVGDLVFVDELDRWAEHRATCA